MIDNKQYEMTINSTLPKEWFKEAEGAMFLGKLLIEYSFEELSAIAAHGWKLFQEVEAKKKDK